MPLSPPISSIDAGARVGTGAATAWPYSPAVVLGGQVVVALLFVLFFHVLMVFTLLLSMPVLVALSTALRSLPWVMDWGPSDMALAVVMMLAGALWSYLLFRAGLRMTRAFPPVSSALFMLAAFLAAPMLSLGFGVGAVPSFGPAWPVSFIPVSLAGMALAWRHHRRQSAAAAPKTDLMSPGDLP